MIIDARDKEEYNKAHLPGAINIPKDTFRTPADIAYKAKYGFLTSPKKAAKVFSKAGIGKNTQVIVYGTNTFPNASIPFVILKQYGHDNVQIMRGEIEKWLIEGHPLTRKIPIPKPKTFKADPRLELAATKDWIMENTDKVVLLDMRSFEEYTGFNRAGNPRGGHIPGAYPVEWKELAGKETVKPIEEMLIILKNNGVHFDKSKEYITYCNWGIGRGTAGYMYLKLLGFEKVRVYGGAMEDWTRDTEFPMSTYEIGELE